MGVLWAEVRGQDEGPKFKWSEMSGNHLDDIGQHLLLVRLIHVHHKSQNSNKDTFGLQ